MGVRALGSRLTRVARKEHQPIPRDAQRFERIADRAERTARKAGALIDDGERTGVPPQAIEQPVAEAQLALERVTHWPDGQHVSRSRPGRDGGGQPRSDAAHPDHQRRIAPADPARRQPIGLGIHRVESVALGDLDPWSGGESLSRQGRHASSGGRQVRRLEEGLRDGARQCQGGALRRTGRVLADLVERGVRESLRQFGGKEKGARQGLAACVAGEEACSGERVGDLPETPRRADGAGAITIDQHASSRLGEVAVGDAAEGLEAGRPVRSAAFDPPNPGAELRLAR